jgi:uncharacterized protein
MSDPKTKAAPQGEPSMEEILASIRRIISEDGDPAKAGAPAPTAAPPVSAAPAAAAPVAPPAPPPVVPAPTPVPAVNDVLELTDVVEQPAPPPPEPPKPVPPAPVAMDEGLVSTNVAAAATGSLASLVSAKRQTERGMSDNPMPLGNAGATIESIVREELRPILKAWLDQNLTPMVERMVQREIQRIARSVD